MIRQEMIKAFLEQQENTGKAKQRNLDLQEWLEWLQPISHEVRMIHGAQDTIDAYHRMVDKIQEIKKELK